MAEPAPPIAAPFGPAAPPTVQVVAAAVTDPRPAGPGRDVWDRTILGWHLAFAVLAGLTAALLLGLDEVTGGRRWLALGFLAALGAWYAGVGGRAVHRQTGRLGLIYVVGAIPLTLGLFGVAPLGAVLLFMLYPHIWAMLPSRRAILATVGAVVGTGAVVLVQAGAAEQQLVGVLVMTVVGLAFALVLGLWITRIIEQSRQRADLVTELAATRSQLAAVSHSAGVLAERERLARDIHDTLAQGFTSILLLLEAVEAELGQDAAAALRHVDTAGALRHVEAARRTARENLAEARALVGALTPPPLNDASLPQALRQLVDRLGPELGVESTLTVHGTPRPLTANHEVALLRAAQEALANVRKHAAAGHVEVRLGYCETGVTLIVADDGRGFDPDAATAGYGLTGMRDRVAEVGGTLWVDARPAVGTAVRVELAG